MRAIGIRELKNRLSEYLRMVRQGEDILITNRGKVIAELREPGQGALVKHRTLNLPNMLEEENRALPSKIGPNAIPLSQKFFQNETSPNFSMTNEVNTESLRRIQRRVVITPARKFVWSCPPPPTVQRRFNHCLRSHPD